MTRSVSSPAAAVLLPLGQPLGRVVEPGGDAYLRVRLGEEIHRLDGPSGTVWQTLHHPRPGTTRGIDRGLLHELDLSALGVADPAREVELLLDLGLVIELTWAAPEVRQAFAESYRLLPLHTVLGNTEDDLDAFALLAGGTHRTTTLDAALRDVLIYGPRDSDLAGVCYVRSGAFAAPVEGAADLSALADPDAYLKHVLERVHPLLDVHAAYFDLALAPGADQRAALARRDPAALITAAAADAAAESSDQEHGLYAVGFLAGARRIWLGLESVNVRVGDHELELANESAWLVWSAAHGVAAEDTVDDGEQAICDAARASGVHAPIFDIDDQQARGMVVRPDDEAGTVEFAHQHRLEPLLCGLGNGEADLTRFRLGVTEQLPLVEVTEDEYSVWRDAHLSASLLDAAHAADRAGSVAELREYLRVVQRLSLLRAAYIDRVRA